MSSVPVQTGVSLGRQLLCFLCLLVPGYLAVRASRWANGASSDGSPVSRLPLIAVGGFASLAVVALWQQLLPVVWVAPSAFLPLEWLVFEDPLSVRTIPRLSTPELVNLVVSQSVVAVVGGYACGATVRRLSARRGNTRSRRPWQQLVDRINEGDRVELVTTNGERLVGEVAAPKTTSGDDVLLRNTCWVDHPRARHRPDESTLTRVTREDVARLTVQRADRDESPGD